MPAMERDGADPFTLHFPISANRLEMSRRLLSQETEQLDLEIQENMPLQINRETFGVFVGFARGDQLFQGVMAALVLSLSGLCLHQRIDHAAPITHEGIPAAHVPQPRVPARMVIFLAENQPEQCFARRVLHGGAFGPQTPAQAAFGVSGQLINFALGDGIQNFFACFPGLLVFWATRCSFSHEVLSGRFPLEGLAKTF